MKKSNVVVSRFPPHSSITVAFLHTILPIILATTPFLLSLTPVGKEVSGILWVRRINLAQLHCNADGALFYSLYNMIRGQSIPFIICLDPILSLRIPTVLQTHFANEYAEKNLKTCSPSSLSTKQSGRLGKKVPQ